MSWQSTMIKGNECFDSHNWLEAERYYMRAIALVDELWQQQRSNLEAMQAWVCGYQNLAATYEQQGYLERALQCLLHAHFYVVEQANHITNCGKTQSNALRMSAITYKCLSDFKHKYHHHSQCIKALSDIDNIAHFAYHQTKLH